MKPYYYIYRTDESRGPKIKHATLAEAQTEAERLANQHPGSTFEILQCVAITRCAQASTFWLDGEEPPEHPRYRMLEEGEIVRDGDEFFHSKWRPVTLFIGGIWLKSHLPHRRKLDTEAPADTKRYRMLEKGERYLAGDEWQSDDGKWNNAEHYGVVSGRSPARRPL